MKANKMPEKIYIFDFNDAMVTPLEGDTVYVREDAFIEKACAFFEENIEEEDCKIGSSEWVELRADYKSLNSFIRAFENYMRGE